MAFDIDKLTPEQIQSIASNAGITGDDEPTQEESVRQAFKEDALQTVEDLTTDLSVGAAQGVVDIRNNVTIAARQITDALGLSDEATTKRRQKNIQARKRENFSKTRFKGVAEGTATATELGLGILGAGKGVKAISSGLSALKSSTAAAGLLSSIQEADTLKQRALNTGIGTATGAAAGKLLSAVNLPRDVKALKAFSDANIRPLLSDVVKTPGVQSAARGIQNTLNNIPGLGIRKAVRHRAIEAKQHVEDVVKSIDGAAKAKQAINDAFDDIFTKVESNPAATVSLKNTEKAVRKFVKDQADDLRISNLPREVKAAMDVLGSGDDIGLANAHSLRRQLDDITTKILKKRLIGKAGELDLKLIKDLRAPLEKEIKRGMFSIGQGKEYLKNQRAYVRRLHSDRISDALETASGKKGVNIERFSSEIQKIEKAGDLKLSLENKDAIKGIKTIAEKFKITDITAKEGLSLGDAAIGAGAVGLGIGGQAAGTLATVPSAGVAAGTAITGLSVKLLGKLVSSEAGVKILTRIGQTGAKGQAWNAFIQNFPVLVSAIAVSEAAPLIGVGSDGEDNTRSTAAIMSADPEVLQRIADKAGIK